MLAKIKNLLKTDGINSKKLILDMLENLSLNNLKDLRREINIEINKMEAKRYE